ncbi:MAG: ATP-binding protein [Acidimicrobiia bacterium]
MTDRVRPFRRRLVAWYAGMLILLLASFGVMLSRSLERMLLDQLTESLVGEAKAVSLALPREDSALQASVINLGENLSIRITVIAPDGTVLADSDADPSTMENHAGRPEVAGAISGDIGVASRTSATVGEALRYVALPVSQGRIVRVAVAETDVEARMASLRSILVVGGVITGLVGLVGIDLVGRAVTRPLEQLTSAVSEVAEGVEATTAIASSGVAELDRLGEAVKRLASEVARRVDQLSRERELRDVVLSALDVGVVLVEEATVVYTNPAAREILGTEPANVSQLHPALLQELIRLASSQDTGGSGEFETPTGVVVASALPLSETDQILLTLTDVTEARRADAVRRDFVSAASHELKTPAAAIQAGAETVIRALEDDPEAADYFARRIEADALRLSRIVADLLDLSRLETQHLIREPVALDGVIRDEAERLGSVPVDLAVDAEEHLVVEGNASDLGLAVRNLLDNAVRYTQAGGHVQVRLTSSNGEAIVEVIDNGAGIPAADLPRIFERFYRVDEARSRRTGGTGLGLAIVKHVAEQHGGRVEAESVLGQGSTFRIILPIAE